MIYLTSFRNSSNLPPGVELWSAAVYQPAGYEFPKAQCFDIRDITGRWIRPREFMAEKQPLVMYRKALLKLYKGRAKEILRWIPEHGNVALCCWCPYEKAAQRQLKEWGSYVCHLSVVGEYLADYTEEQIWYDSDRLKMAVLTQKHISVTSKR